MIDRHPFTDPVRTAGPARIDEPAARLVLFYLFFQQLGVNVRVPHHERSTETGAESSARFDNAFFRARHLCGVATDEVVHGLFRCQSRQRRQYAKGVGGQHDNGARMAGHAGFDKCR